MPDWIRVLVIFAIVYAVLMIFRRRRRLGIMHDRSALAKKFKTTPEDIIEIDRRDGE